MELIYSAPKIPDAPLPLPEATLRRALRVREAAVAYIHAGERCIQELSRRFRVSSTQLYQVRKKDGWDAFVMTLGKAAMKGLYNMDLDLERPDAHKKALGVELEAQRVLVERLSIERDRVLEAMAGFKPGSKEYFSSLAALAKVRAEIEDMVGMKAFRAEAEAARKVPKGAAKKKAAGVGPMLEL